MRPFDVLDGLGCGRVGVDRLPAVVVEVVGPGGELVGVGVSVAERAGWCEAGGAHGVCRSLGDQKTVSRGWFVAHVSRCVSQYNHKRVI